MKDGRRGLIQKETMGKDIIIVQFGSGGPFERHHIDDVDEMLTDEEFWDNY